MVMIRLVLFFIFYAAAGYAQTGKINYWLTKSDRSVLFSRQTNTLSFNTAPPGSPTINIDDAAKYQSIDGFGFALTGGSAQHIVKMSTQARAALIRELFSTDGNGIGVSYIRLSIGASDLNEKVFSYDDLPSGETDPDMKKFDLGPDRQDVIPVIKEILKVSPSIKILGSPWSPPTWMKTNNDTRWIQLKPEYYDAYSKYFVKYIQQMKAEG